jgi:hypothetical protein
MSCFDLYSHNTSQHKGKMMALDSISLQGPLSCTYFLSSLQLGVVPDATVHTINRLRELLRFLSWC